MDKNYQCQFIKDDGTQCRARRVKGTKFCYFHSQNIKDKKKRSLVEEIETGIFKELFGDNQDSWKNWKIILKSVFGESLTGSERDILEQLSGRRRPPKQCKELWIVAGRRSGKSWIVSVLAVWLSLFKKYPQLRKGEKGTVMIVSPVRQNAQVIMGYCKEILSLPPLKKQVQKFKRDEIHLKNGTEISIQTANQYYARGKTAIAVILEETAFFPRDESANPDSEILASLVPCTATVEDALICGVSSPFDRSGVLFEKWSKYYGQNEPDKLVIQAESRQLNPTLSKSFIKSQLSEDYEKNKAEYLSIWRQDVSQFLNAEAIDNSVVPERKFLPPLKENRYIGFVDASSGSRQSGDSFAIAIAHKDKDKITVIDRLEEAKPPFSPKQIVKEFSQILKLYGISSVVGDKWGLGVLADLFSNESIYYQVNDKSTSEVYQESAVFFHAGTVRLLDHPKSINQLKNLVRHARSGRDYVTHRPSGHDDLSNVIAGCVYLLNCAGLRDLDSPEVEASLPISADYFNEDKKPGQKVPPWYKPRKNEKVVGGRKFTTFESVKDYKR
jgi:hypothetical protein